MKRIIAIILIVVMCAAMVACGDDNDDSSSRSRKMSSSSSEKNDSDSSDDSKSKNKTKKEDEDEDEAYQKDADMLEDICNAAQTVVCDTDYEDDFSVGDIFMIHIEHGALVFFVLYNEKGSNDWYDVSNSNGSVNLKADYNDSNYNGSIHGKVLASGAIEWELEGQFLSYLFETEPGLKAKLFGDSTAQSGEDDDEAYSDDADVLECICADAQKVCVDTDYEDCFGTNDVFYITAQEGSLIFSVPDNERASNAWYEVSNSNGYYNLEGSYSESDFSGSMTGKILASGAVEWKIEGDFLSTLFEKIPSLKSKII